MLREECRLRSSYDGAIVVTTFAFNSTFEWKQLTIDGTLDNVGAVINLKQVASFSLAKHTIEKKTNENEKLDLLSHITRFFFRTTNKRAKKILWVTMRTTSIDDDCREFVCLRYERN